MIFTVFNANLKEKLWNFNKFLQWSKSYFLHYKLYKFFKMAATKQGRYWQIAKHGFLVA